MLPNNFSMLILSRFIYKSLKENTFLKKSLWLKYNDNSNAFSIKKLYFIFFKNVYMCVSITFLTSTN